MNYANEAQDNAMMAQDGAPLLAPTNVISQTRYLVDDVGDAKGDAKVPLLSHLSV